MTWDLGPLPEKSSRFAASACSHWIHTPSLSFHLHPEVCCPILLRTGVPVRDHGCDLRLCLRRQLWRRQVRCPYIQFTPLEYGPENVHAAVVPTEYTAPFPVTILHVPVKQDLPVAMRLLEVWARRGVAPDGRPAEGGNGGGAPAQ